MTRRAILAAFLSLTLTALPATAQERGPWRAASTTAQSITGDLAFGNERLTIGFSTYPVAQIRPLTSDEVLAVFSSADPAAGTGHLYRLSIPGDKRFLHKNTLCGSEETQWMATFVSGKELHIALFSNGNPPALTPEALNNSSNLCGTFLYVR